MRQIHCDEKELQILRTWKNCLIIEMEGLCCEGIGVCHFIPWSCEKGYA